MGRWRLSFLVLLIILCLVAVIMTVRNWADAGVAEVRDVPSGDQEIAWLAPATNGDFWERLIAALELLQKDIKGDPSKSNTTKTLQVNFDKAFLPRSADVPEVALSMEDAPQSKLWIRWYKLSGENHSSRRIEKLIQRGKPPLAIIGGETSDRALTQSKALQAVRDQWLGPAPLYFISTATAERFDPRDYQTGGDVPHLDWPKLMEVYDKRTFRFCFTNTRMVEAVLDFVHQNPQVCAQRAIDPQVAVAVMGQRNPIGSFGILSAAGNFKPYFLSTLFWADDGYSKDLGELFLHVFADQSKTVPFTDFYNSYIDYSVGDFMQPNPREALAVGLFLANNPRFRDQPQILALPTAAQRARRFLRTLCRRAPTEIRNVVVITGDAISFNNIYRDHDVAWNIQDMPVPLVFFSHRNPIDPAAGFGQKDAEGLVNNTGTQEVLLQRDMVEALLGAAFDRGQLVGNADQFLDRLRHTRWRKGRVRNDLNQADVPPGVPFFDAAGNRRPGTGEHVIWLRPVFEGNRNLPEAFISVWRPAGEYPDRTWRSSRLPLHVFYDRPNPEESNTHGGE